MDVQAQHATSKTVKAEALSAPSICETSLNLASARNVQALSLVCQHLPRRKVSTTTISGAHLAVIRLASLNKALYEAAQSIIYASIQVENTAGSRNRLLATTLSTNTKLASLVSKVFWTSASFDSALDSAHSSLSVLMRCQQLYSLCVNPNEAANGPWFGDVFKHLPFSSTVVVLSVFLAYGSIPHHLNQFISSLSVLRRVMLFRRGSMSVERHMLTKALPDFHSNVQLTLLSIHDDCSTSPFNDAIRHLTSSSHSLKSLELDFHRFSPSKFLPGNKRLVFPALLRLSIGNVTAASAFEWARFFNVFPSLEDLTVRHTIGEAMTALFDGLSQAAHFSRLTNLKISSKTTFALQHLSFLTRINFQHIDTLTIATELLSLKQCRFPADMVTDLGSFLLILEPLLVLEIQRAMRSKLLPAGTLFELMRDSKPLYRMSGMDEGLTWANEEYGGDKEEWIRNQEEESDDDDSVV